MKNKFVQLTSDILWMMYPSLCAACYRPLYTGEECICTPCRFHMPRTGYHKVKYNPVEKHFWGKVPIKHATAYYYFSKGERVQRLIHNLKYKGRKDVGLTIGRIMGAELLTSPFEKIDIVIPVPLHLSRLRQRGYNQSDCLAEGIAAGMKRSFSVTLLKRCEATETQTRKHRFERYKNVENIFKVTEEDQLKNKNILLVDDVITTGSTLISAAETLLAIPGTSVYIAAIACA